MSKNKKTVKVIKVTKSIPQTAQLETFISSLGVKSQNTELYLCNSNAYINSNIILDLLSVDIKWFLKNAESPTHYLKLSKGVFINKYGMTKILAQSKEAVAYKLQDYLYELLYKVETDGFVSIENLPSRDMLNDSLDELIKTKQELELYKTCADNNHKISLTIKEDADQVARSYAELKESNGKLQEQYDALIEANQGLAEESEIYRQLASKLAKYVRAKSKTPPIEAYDNSLDISDCDGEENDEVAELKMVEEAVNAKKKLATMIKNHTSAIKANRKKQPIVPEIKVIKKQSFKSMFDDDDGTETITEQIQPVQPAKPVNVNVPTGLGGVIKRGKNDPRQYSVLQGEKYLDEDCQGIYRWMLTDKPTVEGTNGETIDTPLGQMKWYCDVLLTDEKRKMILLFLSLQQFYTEEVILQLLNI